MQYEWYPISVVISVTTETLGEIGERKIYKVRGGWGEREKSKRV